MAGEAKENLPGDSLKYLFVYLKVRIFKCIVAVRINVVVNISYIMCHISYMIYDTVTNPTMGIRYLFPFHRSATLAISVLLEDLQPSLFFTLLAIYIN